ncbi:MAG: hypothetical protein M1816_005716 [Peltula sp. TS41687]|nr:MAG: hypothetical protein M1816_005716 [Peltula sp. TS41687]
MHRGALPYPSPKDSAFIHDEVSSKEPIPTRFRTAVAKVQSDAAALPGLPVARRTAAKNALVIAAATLGSRVDKCNRRMKKESGDRKSLSLVEEFLLAWLDSFESAYRTAHGQPPAAFDDDAALPGLPVARRTAAKNALVIAAATLGSRVDKCNRRMKKESGDRKSLSLVEEFLLAWLDSFESAYRTAHGQPPAAFDDDDSDDEEDGGDGDDDVDGDGDGAVAAAGADGF